MDGYVYSNSSVTWPYNQPITSFFNFKQPKQFCPLFRRKHQGPFTWHLPSLSVWSIVIWPNLKMNSLCNFTTFLTELS